MSRSFKLLLNCAKNARNVIETTRLVEETEGMRLAKLRLGFEWAAAVAMSRQLTPEAALTALNQMAKRYEIGTAQ